MHTGEACLDVLPVTLSHAKSERQPQLLRAFNKCTRILNAWVHKWKKTNIVLRRSCLYMYSQTFKLVLSHPSFNFAISTLCKGARSNTSHGELSHP